MGVRPLPGNQVFVQTMNKQHLGVITMAGTESEKDSNVEAKALVQLIVDAQGAEICKIQTCASAPN